MERKDFVTSIVLLVFAGFAFWEVVQLPFGTLKAPQSGFWPLIMVSVFACFSLVYFLNAIKKRSQIGIPFWLSTGGRPRLLLVIGCLVAFGLFFEALGYLVSVFLMIGFLLAIMKPESWFRLVLVALVVSVVSYLAFGVLLKTPLPSGILAGVLGLL